MNNKRIAIPLLNGYKLVAEQNADPTYCGEIFLSIETPDGMWWQDLAIVRAKSDMDSDGNVLFNGDYYEVDVYANADSEDWTTEFLIPLHDESVD